jgi:hypothetical protein
MHWTSDRPGHILRANVRQDVPTRTTRSKRDGPGDDRCNEQHDAICVRAIETCRGAVSNGGNEADRTWRQNLEDPNELL